MSLPDSLVGKTIAVLGGTGPQGRGLARRFAAAGLTVVIGSRSAERAEAAAAELGEATGRHGDRRRQRRRRRGRRRRRRRRPVGRARRPAAELAAALAGKVVVDCVNPLGFDKQGAFALHVQEGSAAQQAAAILPECTVVGAFHNVSAVLLEDPEVASVDTDVLVLGDDREATDLVQASPTPSPASAASTAAGCATPARSRR